MLVLNNIATKVHTVLMFALYSPSLRAYPVLPRPTSTGWTHETGHMHFIRCCNVNRADQPFIHFTVYVAVQITHNAFPTVGQIDDVLSLASAARYL